MQNFAIYVFGFTRHAYISAVLESLRLQDALQYTHVWLDGHQGNTGKKLLTDRTFDAVNQYDVKEIRRHAGNLGFRKMIILALLDAVERYDGFLVLEDDCFPAANAVGTFTEQLGVIADDPGVFSVYGHPFLVNAETDTCSRFQSWGWATTSYKMKPVLEQLIDCYAMTEDRYLEYVESVLTRDVQARIDVTPPRLPSNTLKNFFAWDETVTLLTALQGLVHRRTPERTIYNFGVEQDAAHFNDIKWYRDPPYNMITPDEIWDHYQQE